MLTFKAEIYLQYSNMYKIILLVLLFGGNLFVIGQNIDSLKLKLNKSSDLEQIDVLIELSEAYIKLNNKEAIDYSKRALKLSRQKNYKKGEVLALTALSKYDYSIGDFQSSIKNATRALQIFEKEKIDDINPAIIHQKLALSLTEIGAYSAAIEQRKLQYDSKLKYNPEVDQNTYYINQGIGALYLQLGNTDSAIVYFKKAQNASKLLTDKRLLGSSFNDIGLSYLQNNQHQKALGFFQKAKSTFYSLDELTKRDSLLLGHIYGNIAGCLNPKDPSTLKYYDEFLSLIEKYDVQSEIVKANIQYADYLLKINSSSKAITFLNRAQDIIETEKINNPKSYKPLYQSFIKAYIQQNDSKKSQFYLSKYLQLEDSLYGVKGLNDLLLNHSDYQLAKIENELIVERFDAEIKSQEIEALNTKNEISTLRITILIIAIIFIVLISIVLYLKVKSDGERKRKAQELENKLLELENAKTSERLTQSLLGLQRKKEFSEELINRISEIKSIERKDVNAMKLFINNELEIDESTIEMERFISETGKEFFLNLETLHPDLTEADIKFTALIRMNLSIKQIAVIKNITPQSVKIAKNRLSKKLNLEPGSSIYDYLMTI